MLVGWTLMPRRNHGATDWDETTRDTVVLGGSFTAYGLSQPGCKR